MGKLSSEDLEQILVLGQAFSRIPRISNTTENKKSVDKKESNSTVRKEKQKNNNSVSENSQSITNTSKNNTSYSGDKIAGYSSTDVKSMSVKDFKKLGEKLERTSHNGKARFLKGTDKEAREMFYTRVVNVVENMSNEKGTVLKGVDKYRNKVVYRSFSTRGGSYPTIDVYETINDKERVVSELKFKE